MLNPHIKQPLDLQFDRAIERNAVLIVRLRHTVARLHRHAPDHIHDISWRHCTHEECRKVAVLLGEQE